MRISVTALFIVSLLVASAGVAQPASDVCGQCYLALEKDMLTEQLTEAEALAVLDIMTEDSWKSRDQKVDTGATFPIEGIPFKGNANWSDYQTARDQAFTYHKFTRNASRSLSLLIKKGNDRGYASFDHCVDVCGGKPGLYWWEAPSDIDIVHLKVYYEPSPSDKAVLPIKLTSTLSFGVAVEKGVPKEELFPPGTTIGPKAIRYVEVRRVNHAKVSGVVTGGPYSVAFLVPPPPPPAPPHQCNQGAGAWFVKPSQTSASQILSDGDTIEVVVGNACPFLTIELSWACKSGGNWSPATPQGGPIWTPIPTGAPDTVGYEKYVSVTWTQPAGRSGQVCQIKSLVNYLGSSKENSVGVVLK